MLALPLFVLTPVSGSLSLICHFVSRFLHLHIFLPPHHHLSLSSSPPACLILHLPVSLCLGFCLSVTPFPSSSLVPHQVTVGTGLRSPTAPAQGACGSSCSTPRPWAPGRSSSRPSPCIEAPSPRSCCQRSTSSQVGLWAAPSAHFLQEGWLRWEHEARQMRVSTGERHGVGRELHRGEKFGLGQSSQKSEDTL